MNDVSHTGKIFVSLDGCGTIGYSQALMLNTVMHRIQRKENLNHVPRPCDHIDLIGGSGMGGILALLLGRLRMGTIQAILEYEWFSTHVYGHQRASIDKAQYDSDLFERAFRQVANRAGYNADDPMEEEGNKTCKTVIFAIDARNTEPQAIRSYRIRSGPNIPCSILQAARACMASPDLFSSVHVGTDLYGFELIASFNNPVKLVLKEAGFLFPHETKVAGVLSFGVGRKQIIGIPENPQPKDRIAVLAKIAEDCEGIHQEVASRYQKNNIYYRMNVEHGLHHIKSEEWKSHEDVRRMTHEYFMDEIKKLEALVNIFTKRIGGPYIRDLNHVPNQEHVFPPPPPISRNFVGRDDLISGLLKYHLKPQSALGTTHWISVLWGVGGIGKTQTSIRLWLEFRSLQPNTEIFFMDARSKTNLENDLRTLIRSRDARYWNKDHAEALKWLATTDRKWFIILDNADDPEFDLDDYIPKGSGNHLVITTRNPDHRILAPDSSYQVDSLSPTESTQLLLSASHSKNTPANQDYAKKIVVELHYHSLAIVQAAGYILKHGSLPRYLKLFREQRDRMLLDRNIKLPGYKHTAYATLQLSFDKLPSDTQNILQILSFLNHAQIDEDIISIAASISFVRSDLGWMIDAVPFQRAEIQKSVDQLSKLFLYNGEWDQYDFNQKLSSALQYSLLLVHEAADGRSSYSMHALVQSFLHYTLNKGKANAQRLAVRLVSSNIKAEWSLPNLVYNQRLLPHIRALKPDYAILPVDRYDLGVILDDHGAYQTAELHLTSALNEISDRREALDQKFLLCIKSKLAGEWRAQGKFDAAQELQEEVVRLNTEMLGEEHPDTLSGMLYLGQTLLHKGNYPEAVDMYTKVLEIRRKVLGEGHIDTVRALGTLSIALSRKGDYSKAVDMQSRILEGHRKRLGEEHQDTLGSLNNLGSALVRNKDYLKAAEVLGQVLEARKRMLGEEHPYTLNSMNHLGAAVSGQGQYPKAIKIQTKVLEDLRRTQGEQHPRTLLSMNHLAVTLSRQGDYSKAAEMHAHVLEVRTKVLGSDHSDTLVSTINLTRALLDQGNYSKAGKMQTRLLESCRRVLGEDHPDTLTALNDSGVALLRNKNLMDAKMIHTQVLEARCRVLGQEHPDTLTSIHDLAVTYAGLGNHSESLDLFERVVRLRTKVLGIDHPYTLKSKGWYSQLSELLEKMS